MSTGTLSNVLQRILVDHSRIVLAVFAVCLLLLSWQATRFEIDASAETLLTEDNAYYIETQIVNRNFSPQEFLLIAYQPHSHPVFSERTFADLRRISDAVSALERVESTRSILNVPLLSLIRGGFTPGMDPMELTIENGDYSMEELEAAFAGDPIYEDLLVNQDQTATAIQVTFRSDPELDALNERIVRIQAVRLERPYTDAEAAELEALRAEAEPIRKALNVQRDQEIETIRNLLDEFEQAANLYLGGGHVLAFQLITIIQNDLMVFGSAIGVIICLVLFLLFRELRWVITPIVCCAASVVMTMGLFGFLEMKATVISSNFIALQLILTLAIVMHLIVQYRELQAEDSELDHLDLVRKTLAHKAAPCFYAGITTSVGFGSLLFSGLQPVESFGMMMIVAMFVSIAASLILFPALLSFFTPKRRNLKHRFTTYILKGFQALGLKYPRTVIAGSVLVFAGSAAGALLLDVENSFINYFHSSTQVHRELTFIDQEFGGTTPLDIIYTIPEYEEKPDLLITAAAAQTLQKVQHALEEMEAMGKILSVVNFMELARSVNRDKPVTEYEITALYLTVDKELRDELLGAMFSEELGQARFFIRIQDSTEGLNRADLLADIHAAIQDLGIAEENYKLTSLFVLYQDILQRLFRSQVQTLGLTFVVLSLTFLILFRSIKIAAIAVIPNILSTAIVLGTMGWLGIPLDLMTITIAAVAMGIAVDSTIHFTHRYLEELKEHPPEAAIKRTYMSVGYAILFTSVVIVTGFSMLSFSDFVPSMLFGWLTGLSITAAFIFDMTILAVLLRHVDPSGR